MNGGGPSTRQSTRAGLNISTGLLMTLTISLALIPYSVDAFLPAFPLASKELGIGPSTLQLTLTAFLVGTAAGQLVFGPLSDRYGRRTPLLMGAALCAVAAIAAALAPNVGVLVVARLVQGIAGSSVMVISKAVIRDRNTGMDTTRVLSFTAMGSGGLNIFAPLLGGLIVSLVGWRGPLWFIAAASVAILIALAVVVPETHPLERRESHNRWLGLPHIAGHLRNRSFLVYVVIQATSYGALMAYVSSSPYVFQNVLGFTAAQNGIMFSINAACGVLANVIGNRMLRGVGPRRLVSWGLGLSMLGTTLVVTTWMLHAPVLVIAACITLSMAPLGLNGPNLVGLALNTVSRATGSASAAIGCAQFIVGAIISPVVGLWGSATLWPSTIIMFLLAGSGMTFLLASGRRERAERIAADVAG